MDLIYTFLKYSREDKPIRYLAITIIAILVIIAIRAIKGPPKRKIRENPDKDLAKIHCENCGVMNDIDALRCAYCGEEIGQDYDFKKCYYCGEMYEIDYKKCPYCNIPDHKEK